MISLGFIDLLLIVILVATFILAIRSHTILPFAIVLVLVLFIELERFAPGSLTTMQSAIRGIDSVNEKLPHIQISPLITIQS
jgi:cell shape-determining protein MreC